MLQTHPDRHALLDYLVGKLPDESADSLASHLETCAICQAELATLPDHEDTLIGELRSSPATDPYLDEPECEAALARARTMGGDCEVAGACPISAAGGQAHFSSRPCSAWCPVLKNEPVPDSSAAKMGLFPSSVPETSEISFPRQLGEYRLIERLGTGGMGTVYKALQSKLDRVVALKILPRARTDDPRSVVRFEREMKAIGRLDHPHIVRAYDAREIEGRLVLAMEFVEGLDLGKVVHRLGRLPVADACELARQAALGLQAAHEHGLVHRDVKPSNLMLTPQGQVKLLDLGLARFAGGGLSTDRGLSQFSRQDAAKMGLSPSAAGGQAHFSDLGGLKNEPVPAGGPDSSAIGAAQPQEGQSRASHASGTPIAQLSGLPVGDCPNFRPTKMGLSPSPDDDMTNTGQAMGTADYMAPEQASDSRAVDIRADIYSLGATLYKLLAGQAPFGGPEYHGTFDKMMAHVQQPIPPIQQRCPETSSKLAAVLDRMLAKTPASSFSTPSEAAEALAPLCAGADLCAVAARAATCPPLPPGEGRGEGALPRSPLPPGEGQGEGGSHVSNQSIRPLPAARGRGSHIFRIALALMIFGGLCFALGILITIRKGGKEITLEVPEGSAAHISTDGHVDVTLPGQPTSATQTSERKEPSPQLGAVGEDQKAIQGTWQVLKSTFSLVKRLGCRQEISPEEVLKSTRVIITADTLKILGPEVTDFSFQYRLNPAAKPKMIDLQTPGTFGLVSYGIYELQGNELKICSSGLWSVDRQGEVNRPDARSLRPTEFWAELGSSKELLVLRRVSDAIVSEDEKAIQGDWEVTEAPEAATFLGFGPHQEVLFSRDSLSASVPQNGAFAPAARFEMTLGYALDPTANPNRIDLANVQYPGMDSVHGIYELAGGRLKIAWAVSPQPVNTLGMGGMGSMAGPVPDTRLPAPCPPARLAASPDVLVVVLTRVVKQTETGPAQTTTRQPAAGELPAVNPAAELHALQGDWKVIRVEKGGVAGSAWPWFSRGQSSPMDPGSVDRIHFSEQVLDLWDFKQGRQWKMSFRFNPTAAPATLDLVAGPDQRPQALGIYKLEQDRLTICLAQYQPSLESEQRPSGFATGPRSANVLFTLERFSPSADAKQIRGEWTVVKQVSDAKAVTVEQTRRVQFSFSDERRDELKANVEMIARGGRKRYLPISTSFALDATKKPRQIVFCDSLEARWLLTGFRSPPPLAAEMSLQALLGIYKLARDRLTIAYHLGEPRPQKFESTPGSGIEVLVLERGGQRAEPAQPSAADLRFLDAHGIPHQPGPPPQGAPAANLGLMGGRDSSAIGAAQPQEGRRKASGASGTPIAQLSGLPAQANRHTQPGQAILFGFGRRQTPPAETLPPTVTVAHPVVREVSDYEDFEGVVEAAQTVEIRSRVTGTLEAVQFKGGMAVKRNDLLLTIDSQSIKADVEKQEAELQLAQLRRKRLAADLEAAKAAPPKEHARIESELAEADAALKAAEAGLQVAKLHLVYTQLRAPIDGVISAPLVSPGNLVQPDTVLATIHSVDPIAVRFMVPQQTILDLRRKKMLKAGAEPALHVAMGLPVENYPRQGKIDSAEDRIDAGGYAQWRALFPNADGLVMPGMVVRVRLFTSGPHKALLVPEQALSTNQNSGGLFGRSAAGLGKQVQGPHVFVLTTKDGCTVVEPRTVKLGQLHDGLVVVEEGLTAKDRVVVSGVQGLRPGMRVNPKEPSPPLTPPASPPPQAK